MSCLERLVDVIAGPALVPHQARTNPPHAQGHSAAVGPTLQPPQAVPFPPAMMNNRVQFNHPLPPHAQMPTASQVCVTGEMPRRYAPLVQSVHVPQSFPQCSFEGCTN